MSLYPDLVIEVNLWQKLLAGVWGMALLYAAVFLMLGVARMAVARAAHDEASYQEGRAKALFAGISVVCLAAVAVIVGVALAIVG